MGAGFGERSRDHQPDAAASASGAIFR